MQGNLATDRPDYTLDELKSYLPSGWALLDDGATAWDDKKRRLSFQVLDNVDFDWTVTVSGKDIDEHGRLSALERAFDDAYRQRLGRHTRGLGLAG